MNTGKNDFGPHAVFKTREYYMLKIKSGHKKASLPKDVNLELHNHNVEKRNGYTKIHIKPDSDEAEIVIAMNYFQFLYGK